MSAKRRIDLSLAAIWLALMATGLALDWYIALTLFFAFAAGERWSSFWTRPW